MNQAGWEMMIGMLEGRTLGDDGCLTVCAATVRHLGGIGQRVRHVTRKQAVDDSRRELLIGRRERKWKEYSYMDAV